MQYASSRSKTATRFAAAIAALALALTLGGLATTSQSARADGYGVAWSHGSGGTTALGVYGSGIYVNWVRVSHGDGGGIFNMCGFQGRASGTKAYGPTAWSSTFGYTSGCTPLPYYNDKTVNDNFAPNSNISGRSYHDGAWAPGVPTVNVHY